MCRFSVGGIMEQEIGRICTSIFCICLEWRDLRGFESSEELFQRARSQVNVSMQFYEYYRILKQKFRSFHRTRMVGVERDLKAHLFPPRAMGRDSSLLLCSKIELAAYFYFLIFEKNASQWLNLMAWLQKRRHWRKNSEKVPSWIFGGNTAFSDQILLILWYLLIPAVQNNEERKYGSLEALSVNDVKSSTALEV